LLQGLCKPLILITMTINALVKKLEDLSSVNDNDAIFDKVYKSGIVAALQEVMLFRDAQAGYEIEEALREQRE